MLLQLGVILGADQILPGGAPRAKHSLNWGVQGGSSCCPSQPLSAGTLRPILAPVSLLARPACALSPTKLLLLHQGGGQPCPGVAAQ